MVLSCSIYYCCIILDDTKPKMLMVIITYYFELKEALENPPFSAQCITNFLAEV